MGRVSTVLVTGLIGFAVATPAWAQDSGYGPATPGTGAGVISFPTVVTAQTVGPAGGTLSGTLTVGSITVQVAAGVLTRPVQIGVAEARGETAPRTVPEVDGCIRTLDAFAVNVTPVEAGTTAPTVPVTTTLSGDALAADNVRVVLRGADGTQVMRPDEDGLVMSTAAPAQAFVVEPAACEPAAAPVAGGAPLAQGRTLPDRPSGSSASGANTGGSGLAFTGAPVVGVGAVAVGFLVVGSAAVVLTRRRRR